MPVLYAYNRDMLQYILRLVATKIDITDILIEFIELFELVVNFHDRRLPLNNLLFILFIFAGLMHALRVLQNRKTMFKRCNLWLIKAIPRKPINDSTAKKTDEKEWTQYFTHTQSSRKHKNRIERKSIRRRSRYASKDINNKWNCA